MQVKHGNLDFLQKTYIYGRCIYIYLKFQPVTKTRLKRYSTTARIINVLMWFAHGCGATNQQVLCRLISSDCCATISATCMFTISNFIVIIIMRTSDCERHCAACLVWQCCRDPFYSKYLLDESTDRQCECTIQLYHLFII